MIEAVPYDSSAAQAWDELVTEAPMATFMHSRRFIAYHGDRFEDASLMFRDRKGLAGVLPAALDPADRQRVISHTGATYGGVVHNGALNGHRMLEAMEAARSAYSALGLRSLTYKAVPWIYHRVPSDEDLYALFRLGAARNRVDLSCAIDLEADRQPPTKRRRRGRRRALNRGLELSEAPDLVPEYWRLLEQNLISRHGVKPTHTLEEILRIRDLFPEDVRFIMGTLDGEVVAGTVLFLSPRVAHVQYNATNDAGRETGAMDGVHAHSIEEASRAGRRFFDFGISTEAAGRQLNEGLYRFKAEFGGGGVAYEFYELPL